MDGRARRLLAGVLLACLFTDFVHAGDLNRLNRSLAGHVVDMTHGRFYDQRVWSDSLSMPRDMYVYLPPEYDPERAYPLFLWIHGFGGDEHQFTRQVVRALDEAIVAGSMPPVIAVCPDCSVPCKWKPWCQGSWCINGPQGRWEDYIVDDVLTFVQTQFKIRTEREARVIAGWSMGGFVAYNLAFKHPNQFRFAVGIYPNLDIRYADKEGRWGTDFNPDTMGRLTNLDWFHWLGRYPKPWRFPIPCGVVFRPAWGQGPEALERMSQENPYDLVDRLDIRDGQFDLFIAYGRQDEYNVDAQVDSFLHKARERHLNIWVRHNPEGHHATQYVNECMPDVFVSVGAKLREHLARLEESPETAKSRKSSVRLTGSTEDLVGRPQSDDKDLPAIESRLVVPPLSVQPR